MRIRRVLSPRVMLSVGLVGAAVIREREQAETDIAAFAPHRDAFKLCIDRASVKLGRAEAEERLVGTESVVCLVQPSGGATRIYAISVGATVDVRGLGMVEEPLTATTP